MSKVPKFDFKRIEKLKNEMSKFNVFCHDNYNVIWHEGAQSVGHTMRLIARTGDQLDAKFQAWAKSNIPL